MKEKRISKVGKRHKQILSDSEKLLNEIQERSEKADKKERKKRTYKKKSVKPDNNFDVGDIGVDIDEQLESSENNFESEVDYEQ